uniref:Uncharacterized protein n=1 Tax=Ditylenchus dipsaci TaxID=166011 RepID=A0A915D6M3_9BILA
MHAHVSPRNSAPSSKKNSAVILGTGGATSPGATGSKSAFEQPKSKFKMATSLLEYECFKSSMDSKPVDRCEKRVFMTKKRTADSKFSEFKGGDLNKYTAKSYTVKNGNEVFGGRTWRIFSSGACTFRRRNWRNETTDKKFSIPLDVFKSKHLIADGLPWRKHAFQHDVQEALYARSMMEIESGELELPPRKPSILHQQPPPTALLVPPATLGGLSALGAMMDSLGATAVAVAAPKKTYTPLRIDLMAGNKRQTCFFNQRPNLDSLLSSLGQQSQQQESNESGSGSGSPEVSTKNLPDSDEEEPESPGLLDILGGAPSSKQKARKTVLL